MHTIYLHNLYPSSLPWHKFAIVIIEFAGVFKTFGEDVLQRACYRLLRRQVSWATVSAIHIRLCGPSDHQARVSAAQAT